MTKQIDELMAMFDDVLSYREGTDSQDKAIAAFRTALQAALKQREPVAKYIGECPDGSLVQLFDDLKKGTELYTAATPAQTLCYCKDRPAQECPGEWEPGCDLGNNEDHAVVVQTPPQPTYSSTQATTCASCAEHKHTHHYGLTQWAGMCALLASTRSWVRCLVSLDTQNQNRHHG